MSLSKEALQHLEKTELLNNVNLELAAVKTKSNLIVTPAGFDLVNLEIWMPNRDSYRFDFKTKSINDFGEYCKDFDKAGAKCFVDSDRMRAKTIFDLGTEGEPLHQRHTSGLQLDRTAAFRAILSVNGQQFNQKDAANFIEDWGDNIKVQTKTGEPMTVGQASLQLREITIEQVANIESKVDDFGESMSAMEKVEAKNADKIPASILFTCDPYHGLGKREFVLRLSILTGDSKPKISLRIVQLEAQEEDMAEEFKEILTKTFKGSKLKTFIGES